MAALDLGAAGTGPAVVAPDISVPVWGWLLLPAPSLLALALGLAFSRGAARSAPQAVLGRLPGPWRLLVWFFLVATALTHLFSAGAIWQATQVTFSGNPEYFRRSTILHFFRMSHQHAFGHGVMYLLLGALACLTRASDRVKALGIALASTGALADLASWWLQKLAGPAFEPLSIGAGASFAAGFLVLAGLILRDLLRRR